MARHRMERRGGSEENLCRMSLVRDNLAIVVNNPVCRNGIMCKMVREIEAAAGQYQQLDFGGLVDCLLRATWIP